MKKLIFAVLCCLLFVPTVVAQEEGGELLWELDGEFTVTDLRFTFNLPSTWVFSAENGIAFAENEDDLDAMLDDDASTEPEGYTMRLTTFLLEDLGLEEGATLDDISETVMTSAGIEVSETFDLPLMVYRSVAVAGVNANGRAGVANFWTQDGYLVVFSFGTPNTELSSDEAYTWGNVIGSVTSLLPEDFEVEETVIEDLGVGLYTPAGWEMTPTETGVNFISEDGAMISISAQLLSEIELAEDASLEEIKEYVVELLDSLEYEMFDEGEFIVFDQPGFGVSSITPESEEVDYTIITLGSNGYAISYSLTAPDAETLQTLKPVFILMLQSITALEEE